MFKFLLFAETGLKGYWITLFAKNEKDALKKAREVTTADFFRINNIEEIFDSNTADFFRINNIEEIFDSNERRT